MITFKRVFKTTWKNFFRDWGMVAADLFVMTLTISAITSLFLLKDASDYVISELQAKVDVSVYFKELSSEDDILRAKEELEKIPEVKEVAYVSKTEALEDFTDRHADNPVLMESLLEVGVNPFLASLNVRAFEASQYKAVTSFLESSDFNSLIEKVDYYERKPVIERIFSLTSNLRLAGILFSLILAVVAVLVAFNTVRLAIYNSREEIRIQRLVGASNWFIRGPFLVQGAITGVFSAVISFLLFLGVSLVLGSKIGFLVPGLNAFSVFLSNFWLVVFIQLLCGVGLGVLSSLFAIRRYLEV